jgi:dihydrolipoamide dehydrogenase
MSDKYDVIIIGGGPGGYVAAIRAAQLGLKTACVEKRGSLGGTCLNIGCIPSKALLQSSEKFAETQHSLAQHGVNVSGVSLDLAKMMARKDKVVGENTRGVEFLFKKYKVDYIKGAARFAGPGRLAVTPLEGGAAQEYSATSFIIATGSEVVPLPGVPIDETVIVSSTGGLTLGQVPKHLIIVGGGYIGLEMGSVWRRLGSEVTVVEFLDRITPGMDGELSKALQRVLTKQGFTFRLGMKVVAAKQEKGGATLTLEPAAGGAREELSADIVLVAIGRRPYTEGLGLDTIGVALDNKGRIPVDASYATSAKGVYAIGDVIAGPMLAHKASEEGVVLAERLAGQKGHVNYEAIPAVIYTWPEVSSVGRTEEEVKAAGTPYKTGKFPFTANARARANGDTEGFVKIIADAASDRVLGVHIIGPDAGTMIAEAALAMEYGASAEDIARTCHAHPTLNEAVKEAALAVEGHSIHF